MVFFIITNFKIFKKGDFYPPFLLSPPLSDAYVWSIYVHMSRSQNGFLVKTQKLGQKLTCQCKLQNIFFQKPNILNQQKKKAWRGSFFLLGKKTLKSVEWRGGDSTEERSFVKRTILFCPAWNANLHPDGEGRKENLFCHLLDKTHAPSWRGRASLFCLEDEVMPAEWGGEEAGGWEEREEMVPIVCRRPLCWWWWWWLVLSPTFLARKPWDFEEGLWKNKNVNGHEWKQQPEI